MYRSVIDILPATAENSWRGIHKKKEETTVAEYNGLPYWAAIITSWCLLMWRQNLIHWITHHYRKMTVSWT